MVESSKDKFEKPQDTIDMHQAFVKKLQQWFEANLPGPHVVITHHAPVVSPQKQYGNSPLMPAFNFLYIPATYFADGRNDFLAQGVSDEHRAPIQQSIDS